MVERWLRFCLVVQATTVVIAAVFLIAVFGLGLVAAAAVALGWFIAAGLGFALWSYAQARRYASPPPPGMQRGELRGWCSAVVEYVAMLALFDLVQPFERSWMGEDRVDVADGRVPVLLVHGYLCNRGSWWWLRRKLRNTGLVVATVNLEPPFADIDALGLMLRRRVEEICTETGAEKLALVGHSMGGLVCRAYLRRFGSRRVEQLITLATPHQGTRTAWFGLGMDAREMQPGSAWLRQLAANVLDVPGLAIWSMDDSIVVPQDSARLPGCREFVLPGLGHLAMLLSRAVGRVLVSELRAKS